MIQHDAQTRTFFLVDGTPEEIASLDAKLTRVSPKELRWLAPAVPARTESIPGVRWDGDTKTLWLPRPNAVLEAQLDQKHERVKGQLRWKVQSSWLSSIASFAKSVASVVPNAGFAAEDVVALRAKSCFGDAESKPCKSLVSDSTGRYCGACRCGRWLLSPLDGSVVPKLRWPYLECPLKRPGFSNAQS